MHSTFRAFILCLLSTQVINFSIKTAENGLFIAPKIKGNNAFPAALLTKILYPCVVAQYHWRPRSRTLRNIQ